METVIKCEKKSEWQGKTIYSIHLSDGRGGDSFQEIPIGTLISELQITANPNPVYADRIKWNKPNQGGGFGGGRKSAGNESFSLAYAKDVAVAYIEKGKDVDPDKIIVWAEKFYNWMETKKQKS